MKYTGPPRLAERVLSWVLGPDDVARSVVGDVREDHTRVFGRMGRWRAHLWYWREALTLGSGALVGRLVGKPMGRVTTLGTTGENTMKDALSTISVLLLVSLVSGLIPAVRASRVDSVGALRSAG